MMRRLLTTAGLSAVSAAASRGASFAGILVLAHFLGPVGFGQFTLIQTTALLFTTFCALSLGQMATKIVSQALEQGEPRAVNGALVVSYGSALLASSVLAIPVLLLAPFLAERVGGSSDLVSAYAGAAVLVMTGFLIAVQNGVALALNQVKQQAIANLVAAPLIVAVMVLAAQARSVTWAVLGYVVVQLLIVIGQERVLWRHRAISGYRLGRGQTKTHDWSVVWKLGLPSSAAGLLTLPALWMSMVILSQAPDGNLELGHFSLGNQARGMMMFGVGVVANAVLPMLSSAALRNDRSSVATAMRNSIGMLLAATGAMAALGAFVAPWVITRFAPVYIDSIVPLQWLLLSAVITAPTAIFMRKATADSRPGVLIAGNAAFASILLLGALVATRSGFGAEGMAVAYVLASLAQVLMFAFFNRGDILYSLQRRLHS